MLPPDNILIIRLKSMGDVILTLPAVNAVRAQFPSARITFLTSRENRDLLRGFRAVDEGIVLDRDQLRSGHPLATIREVARLMRKLRGGRFGLVLDFQGYGETAWLSRLTGAPWRGVSFYHPRRQWAYNLPAAVNERRHPAEGHLEFLRQAGLRVADPRNDFHLPAEALAAARAVFVEQGLDPARPTLYLQPLTSGAHKNWPLDHYLAVARHWHGQGVQILFGGGPGDRASLQPVATAGFGLAAGSPLLVTAGLASLATVVLGGDTGVLHLAVALGRRVVMLMHQTVPGSPLPFQHPEWAVAAPEPGAIARLPVDEVNRAVGDALSAPGGNARG